MLLGRGVNGESPVKVRVSTRRPRSKSPAKKQAAESVDIDGVVEEGTELAEGRQGGGRSKRKAAVVVAKKPASKTPRVSKGKQKRETLNGIEDGVAGKKESFLSHA